MSDETWYVDVIRQGSIKNVIKIRGHRACFHGTMLTNTVITVTFGEPFFVSTFRLAAVKVTAVNV